MSYVNSGLGADAIGQQRASIPTCPSSLSTAPRARATNVLSSNAIGLHFNPIRTVLTRFLDNVVALTLIGAATIAVVALQHDMGGIIVGK